MKGEKEGGGGDATTSPLVHVAVGLAVHLLFNETRRSRSLGILTLSLFGIFAMGVLLGYTQGARTKLLLIIIGAFVDIWETMLDIDDEVPT